MAADGSEALGTVAEDEDAEAAGLESDYYSEESLWVADSV